MSYKNSFINGGISFIFNGIDVLNQYLFILCIRNNQMNSNTLPNTLHKKTICNQIQVVFLLVKVSNEINNGKFATAENCILIANLLVSLECLD